MSAAQQPRRRDSRVTGDDFRRLVDEAKASHNLSDIVGRHTALKRRGAREMVGLCPFHAEKSPSFEVNDGKGTWHCWGGCGGGDAMSFLMRADGLSFMEAYRALTGDAFPIVSDEERAKRKAEDAAIIAQRIAIGREIWARSVDPIGTPAEVYARSRGIVAPLPDTVRFVMTPRWRDAETGEVGRDYPAMACALHDATGEVVGVQCVFLTDGGRRKYDRPRQDGTKAKAKLSYGAIIGSAFLASGMASRAACAEVVVCEGPENGLTLAQGLPDALVYVACGADLMPRLSLPTAVRSVVLAGDSDEPGRIAVAAATHAFESRGLSVRAMYPAPAFADWNDELRGIVRERAA
ncbi:CHC2 zinc finger domain-containing protein [Sphingomonas sp. PWP1-2]|uniref:CHC2 zinc finger domain-containing protein n=1 Tax=Sphingomonas sp. PWP1-2 TaxID=2804558 RepID=UPI003CE8AB3D